MVVWVEDNRVQGCIDDRDFVLAAEINGDVIPSRGAGIKRRQWRERAPPKGEVIDARWPVEISAPGERCSGLFPLRRRRETEPATDVEVGPLPHHQESRKRD